jgi:FkbM family methyltransferase
MLLGLAIKRVSIVVGLYRPARWLSRRLRPVRLHAYLSEIQLYQSLLPPDALCFDVGANIGEKSEALLAAGARVVAFEPNPLVLPELRARCSHDQSWMCVQTALGSAASIATLHARTSSGQSSLDAEWEGEVIGTYPVPVLSLDSVIQVLGKPMYCKIDVEGWELEVLRGLTQSLPLISFEFHLDAENIRKTQSCLEWLLTLGMTHANLTPAGRSSFHLKEWVPLRQFLEWFPGDLSQSLPGQPYGDIFVRKEAE